METDFCGHREKKPKQWLQSPEVAREACLYADTMPETQRDSMKCRGSEEKKKPNIRANQTLQHGLWYQAKVDNTV